MTSSAASAPTNSLRPFSTFAPPIAAQTDLRAAITAAYRIPEAQSVAALLHVAGQNETQQAAIATTAEQLITALRAKPRGNGVDGLVHEYSLSSQEGIALMCLAEALLRIPDKATRDALIRDKISAGDWKSHLGDGRSLFVNAATWGLIVTRKLTSTVDDKSLASALTRLIGRYGEPVIRQAVDMAMRMMGEQFVTGQTIDEALINARRMEKKGFRYSYDMLGEAAMTAEDAARYYKEYETAIHAIGKAAKGRGVYEEAGISIKLSALHPRYWRNQSDRVMEELLPRVKTLAALAKSYDIGLNIDAEEADRLELSLDILEALCLDENLAGWNGIGFVVQAYGKRAPVVLDYIIDLARRTNHRIMLRLVKGAYWDAEIKRAQLDGMEDYPVFTRKVHTDVSYIACARKLLGAIDAVFPQFATHNAQSLATIYHMAGNEFEVGQYEFQCLHGMGEPLYEEVVGSAKLNRPARIYAPVGTHETLLAYLVRRLLENGANSSFVNRIADPKVPVSDLTADPVEVVRRMTSPGAPHEKIGLPERILGSRNNSAGLDLSNESVLASLTDALKQSAVVQWHAEPLLAQGESTGMPTPVLNPANHADVVGTVIEAQPAQATKAVSDAAKFSAAWAETPAFQRAAILERAADAMQDQLETLMGIAMREAGKSAPNAVGEVREAIDFLRYYAAQAREALSDTTPLGPIVCISPWNFPLAIFTGQISAALAAGNTVLAKPAEETPLIAAKAVEILHSAGVPRAALQFLPGDGRIGAALVEAPQVAGVMFTGSTEVARLIQGQLANRLTADDKPLPLIAETGGQNAMIVDSSALAEQVVADVIASAFDSAGQRCSALRILCLQEEIADRTLNMLKGAMAELSIGSTDKISTDIGPVISAEAANTINAHVAKMRDLGHKVEQLNLIGDTRQGTFVSPTIIEIGDIGELEREVFGPVLHVIRYKRKDMLKLVDAINATGYGLTFGLHTRLDETIAQVTSRIKAGNIYVNRNVIGAVVGVQPFGGRGLSGTGPKAGGPFYLERLVKEAPPPAGLTTNYTDQATLDLADWLDERGDTKRAEIVRSAARNSRLGVNIELPGPAGEDNLYSLHPRGRILLAPQSEHGLIVQLAAALATGNTAIIDTSVGLTSILEALPQSVKARLEQSDDWAKNGPFAGALIEGDAEAVRGFNTAIACLPGPLVLTQAASPAELQDGQPYCLNWLVEEVSTSINTAAAGGNASLMAIG